MRGHIIKRYKSSYTIVLELDCDLSTGRRKQKWVSVKGTRKDAEKRLAELLHERDTGRCMKPGKTTLKEFLEQWLEDYVWSNLAPRTAEGYETIIRRHLIPQLGHITLTQLKPEHLQKYYADTLAHGRCDGSGRLSPQTVRHHHMTLHCALENAVRWGLLSRNPADAVSPPRYQRTEFHTLNEDDIHVLLEAAKSTPYYAVFHLALFTGMRRSELLALRWCDVDLLLCQVSVSRTLHRLRDGRIIYGTPKTAKGRRLIALSPAAVLALREHKVQQEANRTLMGISLNDDDLVFSNPSGEPLLPDTVTHAWVKLVKRVGLEGIRFHDARHSHASLLLKQSVHPKIVQERLGHASIQITLDTYSHVAPGLQEAAAARFDELVTPTRKNEVAEKFR